MVRLARFSGTPRWLGVAGSVMLAAGGTTSGALPYQQTALRDLAGLGMAVAYAGLTLLVVAWWRLGAAGPATRSLQITLGLWAAPLLICPPLFSRDVYSYLAQGTMFATGMDVYLYGPSSLGGPLAAEVPEIWQHTPAPYGPLFLAVAALVTTVTGTHIVAGVLGMRLVAVAGVALMAFAVPVLARRLGVSPGSALWLGVLNPLVLTHLVAGAHNDALMLGLLVAGLAVVVSRRLGPYAPVLGVTLVTMAALVKAPAALALPFCALLWALRVRRSRRAVDDRWPLLTFCWTASLTLLAAAAVAIVVHALAGTGYGWVGALDTPAVVHNWMSVSTDAGVTTEFLMDAIGTGLAHHAVPFWRGVGVAAAVGCGLLVWVRARVLGPVYALGLGLLALVLLGPIVHPWYVLWGVVLVAAGAPGEADSPVRGWVAMGCAALSVLVLPTGSPVSPAQVLQAVLGGVLTLAVTAAVTLWWLPRRGAAEERLELGADDRAFRERALPAESVV
ncbi:polyprenol phosphomannose-dependent alpha 1,6 mannosyltransferase MptB [Catenuloplanes sp. NPDC051500]|uniref:polyprenol phosphomannose-dependent alpha 1,6 mannosyltransferase MptB n=1 Tax=Catenuloplanes sp. NPDC051500 TaxID=3363959 RepID=UPI0037BDFABE